MKTWEVYKLALENPKAKFNRVAHKETFKFNEKGQLITILSDESKTDYACPRIDEDWELVREPVDFMTAVNSGKRIRSEFWGADEISNMAIKGAKFLITKLEINGKWYIED